MAAKAVVIKSFALIIAGRIDVLRETLEPWALYCIHFGEKALKGDSYQGRRVSMCVLPETVGTGKRWARHCC